MDFAFLFSIVRFKNDVCNATNSENEGICFTASECSSRGGSGRGSCAAGFGTCCVFEDSCYGIVNEKVAYFQNPSYPETDQDTNYCTYGIKVTDKDICQVRLDFISFKMSPPSMTSVPFGQCSGDRLAIFSSQPYLGLSDGNLLCGNMTGQHIYIPTDATNTEENVSLFAMVGTSTAVGSALTLITDYIWNIRVEQIDCSSKNEKEAPSGCLQYFTELTGTIESFNYADSTSPYPVNLDYAICIKRQSGYCGITLTTATVGDSFGLNANNGTERFGIGNNCYDTRGNSTDKSNDYLQVTGAYTTYGYLSVPTAYFCGVYDASSNNETFPGISSGFSGPIVLRFHSDSALRIEGGTSEATTSGQAQGILQEKIENGFRLSYTVTPNCPYINP